MLIYWTIRSNKETCAISLFNRKGWILGLFLFGGYLFQTIGLEYTSPANAAFITSLSVILVPILLIVLGNKPNMVTISAFLIATAGLAILTINFNSLQVNQGDIIVLGTAISIAIQIILTGKYVTEESAINLALAQLLCMAVLSLIFAVTFEMKDFKPVYAYSHFVILAILFTAIFATIYAYVVQTYAQQTVNAIVVAMIFTFEPVFALLYSLWVHQEVLTLPRAIGMLMILGATFMAILQENRSNKLETELLT